jgi:glycosyl-4,4'-diaponeurosporenoate acyltransferase
MLLEIALNAIVWTVIQLGLVALVNRVPSRCFTLRAPEWEHHGRIYYSLGIRFWKNKLPDAGSWFAGGYGKRKLCDRNMTTLDRFAREARRGELVHWCAIGALPLFKLWNSWPGMVINLVYVVAANLPCILVQRYNRARIARLLR